MSKYLKILEKYLPIKSFGLDHALLLCSLVIIWSAIIYYLYALNAIGIILTLVLTGVSFWATKRFFINTDQDEAKLIPQAKTAILSHALIIIFLSSVFLAGKYLLAGVSDRALISPWQTVNPRFFWAYGLSAVSLCLTLARPPVSRRLKLFLVSIFYFLSFSVAAIIYKIGYGFDPFIHQAALEIISVQGYILPKTPYYLGEYGLITILHRVFGLGIHAINIFLVPALAAIFLPAAIFNFSNKRLGNTPAIFLSILFLLTLTFSPFIATTPQNLSYLFLVLAVLSAAASDNYKRVAVLSLASAAIHPLAGLPALALTAALTLNNYKDGIKPVVRKCIAALIWLFTAIAIPLALFLSSGSNLKNVGGFKVLLVSFLNIFGHPNSSGQESLVLNFIYLIAYNYHFLIIIIIVLSIYLSARKLKANSSLLAIRPILISLSSALLVAYFLSSQIIFNNIIYYEQSGFAERLQVAIIIFLLPLIIISLNDLIGQILKRKTITIIIWLAFGTSFLCAALYISYPRIDQYYNSRGYSTSANDLAAVSSIENEAREPYIVLANQQVSAGALATFGFNHYYQTKAGELYFYPIPTGSPLYAYYLDMVYKSPNKSRINEAMDLTGVNAGYLVINKYWYQSGRIINEAKLEADKWWTINNEVFVFKYER